jgi:transcriptional regulator with XRE-family HTH domain
MLPSARTTPHTELSARAVLAVNIIRLRSKLGWSQEMLAFESGLHRTFIAHVERQVRNISLDNIERIAVAFNTPVYMLLMPLATTWGARNVYVITGPVFTPNIAQSRSIGTGQVHVPTYLFKLVYD